MAHGYGHARINSYADAFVFDEMGVTFSVYPDGEFDFYLGDACQSTTVSNGYVDVTFNSGYDYNPYVQYDDFGAVVQVENVPVYYDYYGRVSQIGDVLINYRNRRVCQVGGLRVFYNRQGYYAYHTGFINVWNPYFVYRPFYVAFARPTINLCFVRATPYRQYYSPIRYTYYRPYVHNVRPCYATVGHTYRPPAGYGRAHHRYTQTARGGERAVLRERRKVTTASVNNRQNVSSRTRSNTTADQGSTYTRNRAAVKPTNARTNATAGSRTNARNSKPVSTSVRNSSRTVQSSPATSRTNGTAIRSNTTGKPASTTSRSNGVRSNSGTSRSVKPSTSSRGQSSQRVSTSGRSSNTVNRSSRPTTTSRSAASRPSSSSRSSASKPGSTTRSSGTANRGSSRSSVSKGKSSSSKSGGKVSVGNRSSKRGR